MDRGGFLWPKKERCIVYTFLNYKFYAKLDPELKVVQAPPDNVLKTSETWLEEVFCTIPGTQDFKAKCHFVFSWFYLPTLKTLVYNR